MNTRGQPSGDIRHYSANRRTRLPLRQWPTSVGRGRGAWTDALDVAPVASATSCRARAPRRSLGTDPAGAGRGRLGSTARGRAARTDIPLERGRGDLEDRKSVV